MSILSINSEISTLTAVFKRAEQRDQGQDAALNYVLNTAITAAAANPANSTIILATAQNTFERFADADILMLRKARAAAGAQMDAITTAAALAGTTVVDYSPALITAVTV